MKKNFINTETSRLDRFANHSIKDNDEETIAGRKVSQDENSRRKKIDIVKTSIKLPRELKGTNASTCSIEANNMDISD